jgi:thiol:disulfide interchange protein DsbC
MKSAAKLVFAGVLLALLSLSASADEKEVRDAVTAALQGAKIGPITKLPYGDLYEVIINGVNVLYTDSKGQVGLFGNLVELKTRKNLTELRRDELMVVDFSKLPLDKAIVKVKGNGSRKLAIFTDPDCPYCKQLEKELANVTDVTVYIFLLPLTQLHPDASRKATAIWCSTDRVKAWDDLMQSGKEPGDGKATECATPIADIAKLAQQLNISGTPGLVFSNGKLVPGAVPAEQIETLLAAAAKS